MLQHYIPRGRSIRTLLIQKETSTKDGYTIFESDKINSMDHTRVSGIEPSSVILGQIKYNRILKCEA